MKNLRALIIIFISGTIINVWLFRLNTETPFRGGDATTLMEEFLVYGLNKNIFYLVGGLKIVASILLLFGIYFKKVILPSASLILLIMLIAMFMHFKVGDSFYKHLPALIIFTLSGALILIEKQLIFKKYQH